MNNKKDTNSFETKIKKSFIKYGRIPFILLFVMIFIFMTYEHLIQRLIFSKIAQDKVEKKIKIIEEDILHFISDSSNIKSNSDFYRTFYNFSTAKNIKGQMVIYDDQDKVKFITQPALEGSMYIKVYNRIFLDRVRRSEEKFLVSSVRQDSMNSDINTLMFGMTSLDDNGKEVSIIYFLDSSVLRDILQHQSVNHLIITDANDYVVGTTSQIFVGQLNRLSYPTNDKNKEMNDYSISTKKISSNSLKIHALVIKKSLIEQYGLIIIFMGLALLGYRKANKRVAERVGSEAAESINKLLLAVSKMKQGDLKTRVDINSNDEFERLGDEFNAMSEQLNTLVNRNQQLLELRKNAQIKQLEAQFNPHFLYNSLETIRYLISFDQGRAQKMILDITKLLRYSIDGDTTMVSLKEDLVYLKLFLDINKVRLEERFVYKIDISDDVLNIVMPKLMIQPLIENSIKHGYRNSDHLNLSIIGYSDEENIYIKVIDDGSGMSKIVLENVIKLSNSNTIDSKSYGLHSIVQRLNLIYGKDSKMEIESNENGTTITLVIPKETLNNLEGRSNNV